MAVIELPIEISLRVDHPYQRLPKPNKISASRHFDIETYLVQNRPGRIWYQTAGDVVVGVPEPNVMVRERRSGGNVAVKAARAKIRELVKSATAVATMRGPEWNLPHDFRKLTAEVITMSRLLSEVSTLLAAVDSTKRGSDEYLAVVEKQPSSLIQVKPAIIEHLLSGRSVYELPEASVLRNSSLDRDLLLFETLDVSIESPFFAKLKAYLKWDKTVKIGDIIASAALALALCTALNGKPQPPPSPECKISWSCQASSGVPQKSDAVYRVSLADYQTALREGGVKTAQNYLFTLGYNPGLFDGKDGKETEAAVRRFCEDQGIAYLDVNNKLFLRRLAEAVAKKFPIQESK